MSLPDPLGDLISGASSQPPQGQSAQAPDAIVQQVRRRDLREPSTRRSRKEAFQRADAARRAATRPGARRTARALATGAKPKRSLSRRVASKVFAVAALGLAASYLAVNCFGLLATPIAATASASSVTKSTTHTHTTTVAGQSLTASGSDAAISRDTFAATSTQAYGAIQELAEAAGYTVDNSGPIRWPFDSPVPLGDLFGDRVAPCAACSTFHNGTDFETGDKASVYAVADGTVTQSGVNGDLGYSVTISHVVNGYAFTSVYGHMTAGSLKVSVGDKITKGEIVGLTGSTGLSTGPHLFFEIDINGTPIDSFKWLEHHTKR